MTLESRPEDQQDSESRDSIYSIVLVYNNFADTDECLRSLAAQDYRRHSIIVVDNGSKDGSLARLEEAWGTRVQFVLNERNLGVAGGYNAGVSAALEAGADYVVTCNNDIVVEGEFISALQSTFESFADTGIAVPVILYYDRPDLVWFAGVRQHPALFYSRNLRRGQPVSSTKGETAPFDSGYVPTCATMMSRRALESVGLLDDRFFFGHDDVDWCLRARKKGFRCLVVPRALVRHKVSVTSGLRGKNVLSPSSAFTHGLGSVLIGSKHFQGWRAAGFIAGLVALRMPYNIAALALSGGRGSMIPYLKGIAEGFRRYGAGFVRSGEP